MPRPFPNSQPSDSPVTPSDLAAEKLRRSEAYLAEAQRLSHTGSFRVECFHWGDLLAGRNHGSGIDPEVVRFGRESHWGLQGMRERARNLGGQLRIWSRRGAGTGTEVEISVPSCLAQTPRPRALFLRLPLVNCLAFNLLHRKWYLQTVVEW
jgi:hypothetical protein